MATFNLADLQSSINLQTQFTDELEKQNKPKFKEKDPLEWMDNLVEQINIHRNTNLQYLLSDVKEASLVYYIDKGALLTVRGGYTMKSHFLFYIDGVTFFKIPSKIDDYPTDSEGHIRSFINSRVYIKPQLSEDFYNPDNFWHIPNYFSQMRLLED